MAKDRDSRVIARLDEEERALLLKLRATTGKNTSAVIKAALRTYAESLSSDAPLEVFRRYGVVGAVDGPSDLSARYKEQVDYAHKHGPGL